MTDPMIQLRDYLDAISTSVEVGEIVAYPTSWYRHPRRLWRGPIAALTAAAVVMTLGVVVLVLQSEDSPASGLLVVKDGVIAGSQGDSYYSVGLDAEGEPCAEAGASFGQTALVNSVCGGSGHLSVVVTQSDGPVALAGWVPASAASVTAVYNGETRRRLELTPIPGHEAYAFGAVEEVRARFIEIEVVDDTGEVIERYFPGIGSADQVRPGEPLP